MRPLPLYPLSILLVDSSIPSKILPESLSQLSPLRDSLPQVLTPVSLKGPHRLHPFLRQSELLEELNTAYSQPLIRSGPTMFRIHMVFAIGAVALVRAGVHNVSPLDYYVAAMDHACNTLGLSGVEHIQAVLLVLLFTLQHDVASEPPLRSLIWPSCWGS